MESKVYRTHEVALMLAISKRSVQRKAKAGEIPAPIIDGRWLKSEIDAFLDRSTTIEATNRSLSDNGDKF